MTARPNRRCAALASILALAAPGCMLHEIRLPSPPEPRGRVVREAVSDQERLEIGGRYLLVNNQWNKKAASGFSRVFVEELDGREVVGWQWELRAMKVAAYPEIIAGTSPWWPVPQAGGFPVQVGTKKVTVDYDFAIDAHGIYNLAFDLWFRPSRTGPLSHEIMILNVANGWLPPVEKSDRIRIDGVVYDVFVARNWGDLSGGNNQRWTMVQFITQEKILKAHVDVGAFTDYLVRKGILTADHYLMGVELGTEIALSSGLVEVNEFSVHVE